MKEFQRFPLLREEIIKVVSQLLKERLPVANAMVHTVAVVIVCVGWSIRTYIHTYVRTYVGIRTYICMYVYVGVKLCGVHTYIYVCMCMHACVCACVWRG